MHASSMLLMRRIAARLPEPATVLDVGARDINGSYREIFPAAEYVGLDIIDGPGVDVVVADPWDWPELDGRTYDAVISGQCLEHVERPWVTAQLMVRHCRGWICAIAPREQADHDFPGDYYRYTAAGIVALFQGALDVRECGVRNGSGRIIDSWVVGTPRDGH